MKCSLVQLIESNKEYAMIYFEANVIYLAQTVTKDLAIMLLISLSDLVIYISSFSYN